MVEATVTAKTGTKLSHEAHNVSPLRRNDTAKTSAQELLFFMTSGDDSLKHLMSSKSTTWRPGLAFSAAENFSTTSHWQDKHWLSLPPRDKDLSRGPMYSHTWKSSTLRRFPCKVSIRRLLATGLSVSSCINSRALLWRYNSLRDLSSPNSSPLPRLLSLLSSKWRTCNSLRPWKVWFVNTDTLLSFKYSEVKCFLPMNSSLINASLSNLLPSYNKMQYVSTYLYCKTRRPLFRDLWSTMGLSMK